MLDLAVTFIEKFETHLETVKNSPHLDANLKQMVSIINIAALCFLSWFYLLDSLM
jgi:hypothetical protein